MKNIFVMAAAAALLTACDYFFPVENGELSISFSKEGYLATKSSRTIPDTNSFILSVVSAKGSVLYDGAYGAAPQPIQAAPGSYTVKVVSERSSGPAFEMPLYGDEQIVGVETGGLSNVNLFCTQLNCGIKLNYDYTFLQRYPGAGVLITSAEGSLAYPAGETRTAYFQPGIVNLQLKQGDALSPLMTRSLKARENLILNISSAQNQGLTIQVDTSCTWINEEYIIGGQNDDPGTEPDNAMGVWDARQNVGAREVWVYGYIAGGDLSSSKAKYEGPFTSKTNLLLSPKYPVSSREGCVSVQLQQGDTRDALNLVDNPQLLGRQVFLKGNIVASYYGLPGIQAITEFVLSLP
ncbi:MAG: DUF4493 domain-containing protein [Bacteroidales bacterium]|nr:DUF4493 domain-containing protein [Bacteroidales bacterium]